MSNKRKAGRARGGKSKQRLIAERTTPAAGGLVHVDNSRTFITEGAFIETMVEPKTVEGIVRLDLHGRWSRRVEVLPEEPVLVIGSEMAREIGQSLLEAADAADRDAEKWRETHASQDETSTEPDVRAGDQNGG